MDQSLKTSIIKTLSFFDLFDQPLTVEELYCWLWQGPRMEYDDFVTVVVNNQAPAIASKFGFYFLAGREALVEERRQKTVDNDHKVKIALRAARLLRAVPFVRAVFLCNNVAFSTAKATSDIDVLIVAKAGRVWIARLLSTLLLSVFRLRRTKRKIHDRVCLSFYVADSHLNLANIAITEPDIYLMYWIAQLVPLYDPSQLRRTIVQENSWVAKYLGNWKDIDEFDGAVGDSGFFYKFKRFFEIAWAEQYGNLVEKQAKEIQLVKMRLNSQSLRDIPDTRVVVNDDMLKFHENDRRAQYRDQWYDQLRIFDNDQ